MTLLGLTLVVLPLRPATSGPKIRLAFLMEVTVMGRLGNRFKRTMFSKSRGDGRPTIAYTSRASLASLTSRLVNPSTLFLTVVNRVVSKWDISSVSLRVLAFVSYTNRPLLCCLNIIVFPLLLVTLNPSVDSLLSYCTRWSWAINASDKMLAMPSGTYHTLPNTPHVPSRLLRLVPAVDRTVIVSVDCLISVSSLGLLNR